MSNFDNISDIDNQDEENQYEELNVSDIDYQYEDEFTDVNNIDNCDNCDFEIDMDSDNIPKLPNKIIEKQEKKEIKLKNVKKTSFDDILNIKDISYDIDEVNKDDKVEAKPISIKKKSIIDIKKKNDISKVKIDIDIDNDADADLEKVPTKLTKIEAQFEINPETIEYFSKGLEPIKVFTKKSLFVDSSKNTNFANNDTKIICLLLKYNLIENYKCNMPKCKVKHIWNGKPIQLLLNRKNSIYNDLSVSNLEFLCPNCYIITYGLEMFKKKAKETVLNCDICGFPLVKFANSRKKNGICLACEKKMSNMSYEKVQSSYYNQLQEVYSDNPLLSDDIHKPRHFKDVAKYKKANKPKEISKNGYELDNGIKNGINSTSIIKLNMSVPDLSEIL